MATDFDTENLYVFMDKRCGTAYLRLVGEDSNCIESGEKIEIRYCPFCGDEIGTANALK